MSVGESGRWLAPRPLRIFAAATLVYTVAVILWGAFVRITGSGAGCGQHWPTCHGDVVPRAPELETLIEFTHRWTSGLCLVAVFALAIWVHRVAPQRSPARAAGWWSLVFVIVEALIGAAIVLLGYVADNDSVPRAFLMAFHLVNTYALTGALLLTLWWSSGRSPIAWRGQTETRFAIISVVGIVIVSMTGAVTALGDTLIPVPEGAALADRIRGGGAMAGHYLAQLRIVHPVLACALGLYLVIAPWGFVTARLRRFVVALSVVVVVQIAFGFVNVALSAPGAMQIGHLLLALMVWMALVAVIAENLAEQR